jgi:hypothetical protein
MMKWIAGLAMLAVACGSSPTQSQCFESGVPHPRAEAVHVSPHDVCVPEGTLLLIRGRGRNTIAALRFKDVRDLDAQQGTGCARYELHTNTNGAWRSTAGAVASLGSRGVHPVVVERGRTTIGGADFELVFHPPACVRLARDVEVAPSGWTDIDDVDINDPRLRWFGYDETMSRSVTIPIADLPR